MSLCIIPTGIETIYLCISLYNWTLQLNRFVPSVDNTPRDIIREENGRKDGQVTVIEWIKKGKVDLCGMGLLYLVWEYLFWEFEN